LLNRHSFARRVKNFGLFGPRLRVKNHGLFAPRFRRVKTRYHLLNTRLFAPYNLFAPRFFVKREKQNATRSILVWLMAPFQSLPNRQCVPQSHSAAPIVLYAGRLPTAAWLTILEFISFEHQMTQFARVSRDLNAGTTFSKDGVNHWPSRNEAVALCVFMRLQQKT
jgi:hypothetical protein